MSGMMKRVAALPARGVRRVFAAFEAVVLRVGPGGAVKAVLLSECVLAAALVVLRVALPADGVLGESHASALLWAVACANAAVVLGFLAMAAKAEAAARGCSPALAALSVEVRDAVFGWCWRALAWAVGFLLVLGLLPSGVAPVDDMAPLWTFVAAVAAAVAAIQVAAVFAADALRRRAEREAEAERERTRETVRGLGALMREAAALGRTTVR